MKIVTRSIHLQTLLAAGLLCSHAAASPPPKKPPPGRITLGTTAVKGYDMPRIDASIVIEASVENVWRLVSNCDRYGEFMEVEESKTLWKKGNVSRCRLVVDVPFPFGTLEGISDGTLEVDNGVHRRRWKLVKGDFSYNEGRWELRADDAGHTRVSYSILADPNLPLSRGMLLDKQKAKTRAMLTRLRNRVLAAK
jgi:ribosome-associated toxin RatA of RatAB toxin-antitoxin module